MIQYWGPKTWKLIHCVGQNYPSNPTSEDKKKFIDFFHLIPYILPCHKCQFHLLKQYRDDSIYKYLGSKKNLNIWLYRLHNNVNKRLSKKILNYKQANSLYHNKLYVADIHKLLLFLRRNVQYGHLNINTYNLFLINLNRVFPAFSVYNSGNVIKYKYNS